MERKIQQTFPHDKISYDEFLDLLSAFEHEKYPDGENFIKITKYGTSHSIYVSLVSTKGEEK